MEGGNLGPDQKLHVAKEELLARYYTNNPKKINILREGRDGLKAKHKAKEGGPRFYLPHPRSTGGRTEAQKRRGISEGGKAAIKSRPEGGDEARK